MSNFCPHCGAELVRAGALFCSTCGRALQPRPAPGGSGGLAAQVVVQIPGRPEATLAVAKPEVTIGRDPGNDLVLDSPVVSRRHALLSTRDGCYWIRDLGSTNGTAVNGRLVTEAPLGDGDIVRIGDEQGNNVGLVFRQAGAGPAPSTIRLGRMELGQAGVFVIGRDPSANLHLDHPTISRLHAEVRLTPAGPLLRDLGSSNGTFLNGQLISGARPLAPRDVVQIGPYKLVYDQAGFAQYTPGGNYRIDALRLARRVVVGGGLTRLTGGAMERVILRDVSLSVYPREFVALVGGSGAGKSTLLNAMSGFAPADGRVLVNGEDLYDNFAAYRSILGYVPQDDIIHSLLPVRNALTYAARLRLPDATPAEIDARVNKVLAEVEMGDHAEKQVGRLSGGQRKRVSIASELLAEPGLFFLDEPTSGLDPGLEKKMMYTMRRLADGGRTVLLVTHATANIDQCTQVAFMADGRLTYYGPPQEALTFFGATDFADIYTRLSQPAAAALSATGVGGAAAAAAAQVAAKPQATAAEVWETTYRASPQYQRYVTDRLQAAGKVSLVDHQRPPQPAKQKVSFLAQFGVLARRYLDLIRRDTGSLVILLAAMPLIGLLLLVMANKYDLTGKGEAAIRSEIQEEIADARRDDDPGNDAEQFQGLYQVASSTQRLLFMMALAATLLGLFGAAYEIVKEAPIYHRERMVNLRIPPYLLSKIVILLGFGLVQCLLLLVVMSLRVDYPGRGVFLPAVVEMYVTLVLATLASITMGLLISAVVRSSATVIYIILVVLFVQIIFAGAIFEIPAGARPISYLTTTRWTLEALGSSVDIERLNARGGGCLEPEEALPAGLSPAAEGYCDEGQTALPPALTFNIGYEHSAGHLLAAWLILLGFAAAFLGLTVYAQRRKDVV